MNSNETSPLWRLPWIALALAALICGVWGGLLRLPLNLPLPVDHANWITLHGPLMVCGFLGTLIGVERAVGLRAGWAYLAPAFTAAGGAMLFSGSLGWAGPCLLTAGSVLFAAVSLEVIRRQRELHHITMGLGALLWVAGNALWLADWPFNRIALWWGGFLALTIWGERLELRRFQRPSPAARPLFVFVLGVFLAGLTLGAVFPAAGDRLAGLAMLAMALWLARFDIARHTVKAPGLPRFTAACLLSGYLWLALAGACLAAVAPLNYGRFYDAALHAFFLGFVFSMIFGHAPIIFPAVLKCDMPFRRRFYLHLVLLHAALVVRVLAGVLEWPAGRVWGGALNGVAIALFLASTAGAVLAGLAAARRAAPVPYRAGP